MAQEPNEIMIAGRPVGPRHAPLVIAELGINHGGNLQTAFEMVDAAARAGVEVLKHQTHVVEDEMSPEAMLVKPGNSDKSIYQIMEECSLGEEEERKLKDYVESKGMIFISTPFSRAAFHRLVRMNVQAVKIGSGECNNYPLLRLVADYGKPVILSTGMNSIGTVAKAVSIFRDAGVPLALLHTTNLYPTPAHLVRLGGMVELAKAFPEHVFGLSDHTSDNLACLGAVALGASLLERHFTDLMSRTGPDIVCSMDEVACAELIRSSRVMHTMLGGRKEPCREEQVTMDFAFATVVSIKPIRAGDTFSMENLWVKRPGTGAILAERLPALLGLKARKDIPINHHLSDEDIAST